MISRRLQLSSLQKIIFVCSTVLAVIIVLAMRASASVATLSYGFPTEDNEIIPGMAVASMVKSEGETPYVERASNENMDNYVGIATAITPATDTGPAQVFVTQTGQAEVYATSLSGEIKKGDYVVLSPLRGMLMRAPPEPSVVLGNAITDFSVESGQEIDVTTDTGETRTVTVNKMLVNLNFPTVTLSNKPSFLLVQLTSDIIGREVSLGRVIMVAVLLIFLLIVEGAIIYGAIHSSIISLGRNPLSKQTVYKELINVSLLVLLVLAAGFGVTYLILWF